MSKKEERWKNPPNPNPKQKPYPNPNTREENGKKREGEKEKGKRKRRPHRLFPYPQKETSLAFRGSGTFGIFSETRH